MRFVGWADWVDYRCFLSFVFLGDARRLELSPCNTQYRRTRYSRPLRECSAILFDLVSYSNHASSLHSSRGRMTDVRSPTSLHTLLQSHSCTQTTEPARIHLSGLTKNQGSATMSSVSPLAVPTCCRDRHKRCTIAYIYIPSYVPLTRS